MNKLNIYFGLLGLIIGIFIGVFFNNTIISDLGRTRLTNISTPDNSSRGTVPYFRIVLGDKEYELKIEYKISSYDAIITSTNSNIIYITTQLAKTYTNKGVFLKNLIWHLDDKIPILTGAKRFKVIKIFIK